MINVTQSSLPPFEEYSEYLRGIWERVHLTNHGPLVTELESQLRKYLDTPHFSFLANGTLALQIAIKALNLSGEIVTTPFSYVATTSSIAWEGLRPVFVDIEPDSLTIDPRKIEEAITPETSAILATHVYGVPCDIDAIEEIAKSHNLKVIYDAAHCFGGRYKGKSLPLYGDVSALSFHATKLFHTIEGGGLTCADSSVFDRISYMRNFGHNGKEDFFGVGINAKNCEFHAAMGLCNLPKVGDFIKARKTISELYDSLLVTESSGLVRPFIRPETDYNFSYYAILFPSEQALLRAVSALEQEYIIPRRYFYPCLSGLNYVPPSNVPIAEDVASRVLCLPLHQMLHTDDVEKIAAIVLKAVATSSSAK